MNIYLTGGAVRDIISGFIIRDLDFSVQGNALKLQKDFEKAGAKIEAIDETTRTIMLLLPGNVSMMVRVVSSMASILAPAFSKSFCSLSALPWTEKSRSRMMKPLIMSRTAPPVR